jgi:DNA-binding transcriptional regulator YdaS (Cro superfamily)
MNRETPLALAIKLVGGAEQVAALCGLKSGWAVRKWLKDGLPAEHVIWLSERTAWRVTPHQLAPEMYPYPDDGLPVLFRKAARRSAEGATPAPEVA